MMFHMQKNRFLNYSALAKPKSLWVYQSFIKKMFESYIFAAFLVCLIIGLPTFFSGCGTSIPNTCFAYYETTGTIFNYKITDHICSECTQKDKNKKCTNRVYFQCFDGYVKIHFANNKTCLYEAYSDQKSFSDVQNLLSYNYPVGESDKLFVNKLDYSECSLNDNGLKALTYVGLTFLSFAGFLLIVGCGFYINNNFLNRSSFSVVHCFSVDAGHSTDTSFDCEKRCDDKC